MENKKDVSVCANCGKEGDEINNICNKCKQVKYCDAACKKKHRHKHKKECEEHIRLAAKRAAELHDKELFKEPPPAEDCPICFLLLPTLDTGRVYMACCGKRICSGCIHAPIYDIIKATKLMIKNVLFVEPQQPHQIRRTWKGCSNGWKPMMLVQCTI